jgi:hypothetical protein
MAHSALDRRLEFCIAAKKTIDFLPAVVICIVHSFTFRFWYGLWRKRVNSLAPGVRRK